jgi:hypothetical protein
MAEGFSEIAQLGLGNGAAGPAAIPLLGLVPAILFASLPGAEQLGRHNTKVRLNHWTRARMPQA